jgi:hypothetical protein
VSSVAILHSGAQLAAGNVQQGPDPAMVSPGFAGFVAVFLLALATVVLVRSMVKHLRKVRYSPDPADDTVSSGGRPQGSGPA